MATAQLTGSLVAPIGRVGEVHTSAKNPVMTRAWGTDASGNPAEYIYLLGVASTIAGSVVTYDELGVTALLAANAKGFVAIAMAATDSTSKWGWYGIFGTFKADVVANTADNSTVGRETSDGKIGDGKAAGDEISGAFMREATTAAALANVHIQYPFVNDFLGA